MENKKPTYEVKLGTIKGTVWLNDVNGKTIPNISITRLYKKGNSWESTSNFTHKDLLLVSKVADDIHSYLYQSAQK